MKLRLQPLLVAVACVVLSACSGGEAREDVETKAVPRFHAQYDRGDFDAIYNGATDEFRNAMPKAEYDKFMRAVRQKLGRVKTSARDAWNVQVGTGGTRVLVTYNTQFERGNGVETFTFLSTKGDLKLVGYHVNSNALIIN